MNTLSSPPVQSLLKRLHEEARTNDPVTFAKREQMTEAEREVLRADYRQDYAMMRDAFLPVGEDLGRLLYLLVRSSAAKTLVEFGTSFGISTIYLAAALRDNGGGRLITCEMEPTKTERARQHLMEAGLVDLIEFRVGDALDLLAGNFSGPVDFFLLDGAKPLYYDVLKKVEPHLKSGALIAADNVNERNKITNFTGYVRDPANGYTSVAMPLGDGIELSLRH